MRHAFISLLIVLLISSCKDPVSILDTLIDKDRTVAKIISYELVDNKYVHIKFDSKVELVEFVVDKARYDRFGIGDDLNIALPYELSFGEEAIVSITVKKESGNKTRASLSLQGYNELLPMMVINEVSTNGTSASPDRVELYILSSGNVAGAVLETEKGSADVTLPSIDVSQGDIIVIYWNKTKKEADKERATGYTYYLDGKAEKTLSSKNGVLILRESKRGDIIDAIIYSDSTGSFTESAKAAAAFIIDEGHWSGDSIDSEYITSSRVLARRPGALDTDTADDWFTTMPRRSTFGEENVYAEYIPNE